MDWLKVQPRKVPVVAGASTAFGCSIDGVSPTAKIVALCKGLADSGLDEIMLADTVGYAHPAQIKEVVTATHDTIRPVLYGLHLHDTCDLSIANGLAGLEVGMRAFDSYCGSGAAAVCARPVGKCGDRGFGVPAEEHGFHHRHRNPGTAAITESAAREPAGGSHCTARCPKPDYRRHPKKAA